MTRETRPAAEPAPPNPGGPDSSRRPPEWAVRALRECLELYEARYGADPGLRWLVEGLIAGDPPEARDGVR